MMMMMGRLLCSCVCFSARAQRAVFRCRLERRKECGDPRAIWNKDRRGMYGKGYGCNASGLIAKGICKRSLGTREHRCGNAIGHRSRPGRLVKGISAMCVAPVKRSPNEVFVGPVAVFEWCSHAFAVE